MVEDKGTRKQMAQALRQAKQEKRKAELLATGIARKKDILNVIMENTGAMLAYFDTDFNFIEVNPAYARGHGYSVEELIGKNHFDLFPSKENRSIFEQVRNTGELVTFHDKPFLFVGQPERGMTYWDWTLTPVKDASGKVQGLVLSLMETTERKHVEEEMRIKDAAIDSSLNAMALADLDGNLVYVNPSFLRMWGTTDEKEILGKNIVQFMSSREEALSLIGELKEKGSWTGEVTTRRKDGSSAETLASMNMVYDESAKPIGMMGSLIDITERKRAEEAARQVKERRRAEEELRALSRHLIELEENERRAIARELHDQIGQLLTVLKILLDRVARLPAEKVAAGLSEAQELVNELIAQVRSLSLDLRPAMLDDLGLLPTLLWHFERYTAQAKVRVNFKHSGLSGHLPLEVSTAAYRIVQEALANVARHSGATEVAVYVWASSDVLGLRIEDKGHGFDAKVLGVSSGISGMRERARLLGGKLSIVTDPGAGTCVSAELPFVDNPKEGGGEYADASAGG